MNEEMEIIELGTASEETQSTGNGHIDSALVAGYMPGT
jgi:hypothetical protein